MSLPRIAGLACGVTSVTVSMGHIMLVVRVNRCRDGSGASSMAASMLQSASLQRIRVRIVVLSLRYVGAVSRAARRRTGS